MTDRRFSILRQQPVEPSGELDPGATAARRGYSLALLLPLVTPADLRAELLGGLAPQQRQLDQEAQRRRALPA